MVPAPFCASRYIDDPKSALEVEASIETRSFRLRKTSVVSGAAIPKSRQNYREPQALQTVAPKKMRTVEKLFLTMVCSTCSKRLATKLFKKRTE